MNTPNKPRVVNAFEKLDDSIQHQIKLEYPEGFSQHLISFMNKDGEKIYLIKMSIIMAEQLIEDDEDYDDDGNLTDDARENTKTKN